MHSKNLRKHVHRITPPMLTKNYSNEYKRNQIDILKYNISNIFYDKPIVLAYEELYTMAENLCTLKQDVELQEDLTNLTCEYLRLQLMDLICFDNLPFLLRINQLWFVFCHKIKMIRNIYLYLEVCRNRVRPRKFSIWQMCCELFRKTILHDSRIKQKLNYIFNVVEMDRKREEVDTKLLQDIVDMLSKLDLYTNYFECAFLKKTEEYYREQRAHVLALDILEYFYYVQVHMVEEKCRVINYFKPESEKKVYNVLFKTLIQETVSELIAKLSVVNIFDTADIMDISTIYSQLCHIPSASESFCKIFADYMFNKGQSIICDTKTENFLVTNLLEFKDRIDRIVEECFKRSPIYVDAVRLSFKKFINLRKYKPAQFLAKFIDSKMRDKLISEDLLDKIMVIFRYIQGKDVFEAYYKRYLAKRLLLGKSSSQDAEKYMIGKLKMECGDGFTTKLEGMFKDIDLSESLIQAFKQRSTNDPIEFSAYVLTNSFWPTFTKFKVNLSEKLIHYQNVYQNFYKGKYSGRSLEWICSLDSCLLKARFDNGPKELQVSLFQALILLLFNDYKCLAFRCIREHLDLDDAELGRTLSSLTFGKIQILKIMNRQPLCSKANCKVLDEDEFSINEDFSNKLFRIKINQLQYKETEEEQKITETQVLHDRHLQIDAGLVRLMKQNRTMNHNDLIAMIYMVLKFPLNPNDIKRRIEILIERDFLARNPDDPNSYVYVA